ncbi:hypothetical protein SS50377_23682 [Spironucleus salmonicida]|uniref:Uncharacterized protein n=1 Tax=Spironucleus salmonicida TaxID=348837 RepID=V6LVS8_9EUKA|nr:hypothetical protein SS50377_23682 [Spironucleus salmonicida]|eukprot:EST48665.1 Hypothetical protein SS50377_11278 [Spironucleus salmonicida]
MSDEEPSWASDTPLEQQAIIKTSKNPLIPQISVIEDYNKEMYGIGSVQSIYSINNVVCIYTSDLTVRVFNNSKFIRQFIVPKPPASQFLFNENIYFFFSTIIIQINIISGIQKTLKNTFGRVTYAKKVEENAIIINGNNVSIIDIHQLRSITDYKLRFSPSHSASSSSYVISANNMDIHLINLKTQQKFSFTTTSIVTYIETMGDILVIGTKSGMVDLYQINNLNFDTKSIQPTRSYKNLTDPIKCISIQPQGKYIFYSAGQQFRLISIDKLEICAIRYMNLSSSKVIWKDNVVLLGKMDGRVMQIQID